MSYIETILQNVLRFFIRNQGLSKNKCRTQKFHHKTSWNKYCWLCSCTIAQMVNRNLQSLSIFYFSENLKHLKVSILNKELCVMSMRDCKVVNKATEIIVEWGKSGKDRKMPLRRLHTTDKLKMLQFTELKKWL